MTLSMVLVAITLNNMFTYVPVFSTVGMGPTGFNFQHHLHQQHNVHIDFQLGNDILQRKKRTFNTYLN